MMDIHELQELWKSQLSRPGQTDKTAKAASAHLIENVKSVEAALVEALRYKLLITSFCVVYLLTLAFLIDNIQAVTLTGYIMVVLIMGFNVYSHWINRIKADVLYVRETSIEFLKHVRDQYEFRKKLAYAGAFIYGALLGIALYLGTIQFVSRGSMEFQFLVYGLTFSWVIIGTVWMYRRQRRKLKKEVEPILDQIEELILEWESR